MPYNENSMRKVKADLHNHLRTSSNMKGLFNPAIDLASKRLGKGGIFALVNFEDERYERFSEENGYERKDLGNAIYVPEKDILVVKGQEIPTKKGHLLVLGLERGVKISANNTFIDIISEARYNGGIIIADHPFYHSGIGKMLERTPPILNHIDAIEGHNGEAAFGLPIGPFPLNANRKAQEFYEKMSQQYPHLGMISTSDGHSLYELGKSYIDINMPEDYLKFRIPGALSEFLLDRIHKSRLEDSHIEDSKLGALRHITALLAYAGLRKLGKKAKCYLPSGKDWLNR